MQEVFHRAPDAGDSEPVHGVYYTITARDVGASTFIETTAGKIPVGEVLGRVQRRDVGKRVYAVLSGDRTRTVWQAENDGQRDERLIRLGHRDGRRNALDEMIAEADKALDGDSNDAEHDALYSLREQLDGMRGDF